MNPPGPSTRFPVTNLVRFRRDAIGYLRRLTEKYGDVVSFSLVGTTLVLVNQPDLISQILVTDNKNYHKSKGLERAKRLLGEGLLTSEGEVHLQHRRMLQPAFHRQRVDAYAATMIECSQRRIAGWSDGQTIDLTAEMPQLTLAIVGHTLFNADIEAEAPEVGEALTEAIELFNFLTLPFAELLERFPIGPVRRFRKAKARLDATVYRLIDERRKDGKDYGDFLSMVLAASDQEDEGRRLSDEEVRDQVMTIFLAGHETTATAMIWTLCLISLHPDVERLLLDEIESQLGATHPSADDLARLPYTRAVLTESMRLYPPAWMIGRKALTDTEVGGYTLPKGVIVLMSPAVTQRDARYYDRPDAFDPGRWIGDAAGERPKMAYFPFGGGPRVCIGERFAWMEMMIVLTEVIREWHCDLVPGQTIGVKPILTQRPSGSVMMTLRKRNNAAAMAEARVAGVVERP